MSSDWRRQLGPPCGTFRVRRCLDIYHITNSRLIRVFSCRMPPSEAGEWWELFDEARDIPYYYHTKTKETQWTRPEGFVIPLNIIQVRS